MMKKKKLICASLALLLAGCSTTQKTTMEDLYSNISLDAGFDTVLYYQEYNSDTEASKAHFEEVVSLFSHYNELFDIYNDYEGVANIKTINDFAGVSPVVVDPVIIEMLNEAKSFSTMSNDEFDVTIGSLLKVWHNYREEGQALNEEGKEKTYTSRQSRLTQLDEQKLSERDPDLCEETPLLHQYAQSAKRHEKGGERKAERRRLGQQSHTPRRHLEESRQKRGQRFRQSERRERVGQDAPEGVEKRDGAAHREHGKDGGSKRLRKRLRKRDRLEGIRVFLPLRMLLRKSCAPIVILCKPVITVCALVYVPCAPMSAAEDERDCKNPDDVCAEEEPTEGGTARHGRACDADEKGRQEYQRKIYVCAGQRGNAVIAARNKQGDIVWSWHIWVTENDPGNVSSAILYTTYAWNEEGIKTGIRVPGYDIMPCNLGALRYEPDGNADASDTYGMLYQWGRKDPFPPAYSGNDGADYTDERAGVHYGNDNKTPVGKTTGEDNAKLFHSLPGAQITEDKLPDPVGFTVKNPTVFMCGTKEAKTGTAVNSSTYYQNGGDWTWNHDDKLWGGLKPGAEGMKCYTIPGVSGVHIYDNYGDQKTIFDPCPSGWRVPPGELWLGFTKTGLNPATMSDINTSGAKSSGMYMYMAAWRSGPLSYFPTQGTRVANGGIMREGVCGNYHNATTDLNNRVNILHIHNAANLFHIFETTYYMYYVKAVAGPVRCVRDHK